MRLHRNLVFAVIDGLDLIFNEKEYADKVVQKLLKRDKRWGARDRAFVALTTYEMVRWKRLYTAIAEVKEPYTRKSLWRLFAVWATLRGITLPEWNQIEETPVRKIKGRFDELSKIRKYRESVPDWMDDLGIAELGEAVWEKELARLNKTAEVILRVNTLKATKNQVKDALLKEEIECEPIEGYPYALKLKERANVFSTEVFKKGWFEVQDASSQLVADFLEVKPGMRVIDACAGAGGKTLHLASLMENKGVIIALDIYAHKLAELKKRAKRNGAHNIETRPITSTKIIKKLHGKADRVLLDAPCSGFGVLRRNPDSKWKLKPEFINEIKETQQRILTDYSKMVKSGGKLVYATCSILPSENQKQVEKFLNSPAGASFTLEEEKRLMPSKNGFDGFYMARMVKE